MSKVYQCINEVQKELSKIGVGKDDTNQMQKFKFRGIDAVLNALAPLLSKHGLCMLPRVLTRDTSERQTKNGGTLFFVCVEVEYTLVSAEDGSTHAISTFGEAMDSGDKATNKAMSAAYKYAAIQAFCIPTEGDNDADSTTHDAIVPKSDSPTISKTQLAHLREMIAKTNSKEFDICKYLEVDTIETITMSTYEKVLQKLNTKFKKMSTQKQDFTEADFGEGNAQDVAEFFDQTEGAGFNQTGKERNNA